jgi:hypothetical protein
VENIRWEGRGEAWFINLKLPPESIKDQLSGPSEQVRLCNDAYKIYGVPQT